MGKSEREQLIRVMEDLAATSDETMRLFQEAGCKQGGLEALRAHIETSRAENEKQHELVQRLSRYL